MQIGAMNHPARDLLEEIAWFGRHGFDFVDFTLEPPAADPGQKTCPLARQLPRASSQWYSTPTSARRRRGRPG